MPRIPHVSKEDLVAAMDRFDREFRSQPRWLRWPTHADKFALAYNGKRYPVKFVIALATGVGVHTFSGGQEANGYVTRRGLTVVDL
ncbi:hypothetical protein K2Z83_20325 [Oscillochloris sp. ZM17-4]|uniref:hypothetical protein n=1 Tax=Oscillochloris sp. ZM17-4 TaxID=2866714 RepID=UPI001C72FBF7|nr:hypothetical protein [Oscillochloris sp. ZM17-4]MBX0330018.1 hypothetical protein [Oscillochloris sp. ZM17-4]